MKIYYDITIKNDEKNNYVSYFAEGFSIDENRILKIKSKGYGDISVKISPNERLIICDVIEKDEWNEFVENMKQ